MPIQIGAKGATLFGNTYPPYAYIDWFTPDQEAQAKAGGDAFDTPSRGFTPQETLQLKGVVSGAGFLSPTSYGARVDGQVVSDATVSGASASSMTITSASGRFRPEDVGKTCGHVTRGATGHVGRYGTITGYTSPTSVTASLSGVSTGSNHFFAWGTDDSAALIAMVADAHATKKPIIQPEGICIFGAQVAVPLTGIRWSALAPANTIRGALSQPQVETFAGAVLLYLGADPGATGAISQGSTSVSDANNYGANFTGLHICAFNRASCALGYQSAAASNRNSHVRMCTLSMSTDRGFESSASGIIDNSVIWNTNRGNVLRISGDSKMRGCYAYGAGNGYYTVRAAGSDIQICENHLFRDAATASLLGGQVEITGSSSQGSSTVGGLGSIVVANNTFDTSYGPHVSINLGASAFMRGVSIAHNVGFQNDNFATSAVYPWMAITVASGGDLRGLSVMGNVGQGSWATAANGPYTAFIDGSGIAGAVRASAVIGNTIEACAAGYVSFTPTVGANLNALLTSSTSTTSTTF